MPNRFNLHTHTYLCQHATGTVDDYCEAALSAGIRGLGFSDHCPFPDGRWGTVRMPMSCLPDYVQSVRSARAHYAGHFGVLLGLECEYVPDYVGYMRDELLGHYEMDYLLGAPHSYLLDGQWISSFSQTPMDDENLRAYTEYVIALMESGLFRVVAHPDLFGYRYRGWDQEASACSHAICRMAASGNIFLELNAYGLRKHQVEDHGVLRAPYPVREFWEIACEEGVQCVANSDAHRPEDVWGNTDECLELARKCGLEPCNETLWNGLSAGDGHLKGGSQ